MTESTIRIICGIGAVLVLIIIIWRRSGKTSK